MAEPTIEQVTNRPGPNGDGTTDEPRSEELEERRLAHWVADRWNEAEDAANQDAERQSWDQWVNAYWGEAPSDSLPSFRGPILTTEMRDLILHEAQEIMDTKPRMHVMGDQLPPEILKMAEKTLQAKWLDCDVRGALLESIVWSKILPCGWVGVYWDPMLRDGTGDIAVCAEDPRQVLPAPQSRDDLTWPYVIKEDWLDLWAIRQRYPDKGHLVREDTPPVSIGKKAKSRSSPYLGPMFSSPNASPRTNQSIPQSRILTIWVRDPGTEVVYDKTTDPQTGAITKITSRHIMKYPRGRFLQVAGDIVLADIPWRVSTFPLFRIVPQPTIGGFWQSPFVRDSLPVQQGTDKAWEQLVQNMERVNEGVWFTTGETGIDPSNFTPMPGMVVQGEPGSTLEMKGPPAFPESFMNAPDKLASIMRRKAGYPESRMGSVRGANIGQGLMETEISQAEAPTRMTASLVYKVAVRIAQHMLETIALMYRTKRPIPFRNVGAPEMVQWSPIDEDKAVSLISHIDPSSFYPRSETLEKGLIMKLGAMGMVGPEYVLKHIPLPDLDEAEKERKSQLFQLWQVMQQKGKKKR